MKKIELKYESISGIYEIKWKWVDKKFHLDVKIPYGTEAEIVLPNGNKYEVKEGEYHYECDIDKKVYVPFSVDTPLLEILKNEQACEILKKYAPSVYKWAINENEENKLNTIRNNFFPMHNAPIEEIQKCEEELSKIYP